MSSISCECLRSAIALLCAWYEALEYDTQHVANLTFHRQVWVVSEIKRITTNATIDVLYVPGKGGRASGKDGWQRFSDRPGASCGRTAAAKAAEKAFIVV